MADSKISSFASHGAPVAADYVASVLASGPTSKRLLLSDAQDFMLNAFGGGTEIAVTGAVTATIGRMHHCTGTTADYTVTLPAASGNTGKLIGFRMGTTAALTKLVTLDGNASETIDGATTRVMWATETAILLCDGSNWFKIAGKSVPMIGSIAITADQTGIVTGTITKITCDSVIVDNTGLMADTTNNRVYARRAGNYLLAATELWSTLTAASTNTQVRIHKNNDAVYSISQTVTEVGTDDAGFIQQTTLLTYAMAKDDYVDMRVYHSCGSNQTVFGNSEKGTNISVTEIASW